MKQLAMKAYHLLMAIRNTCYDQDILDVVEINKPVISVGNLSFGGSGKTPMVDFLVSEVEKRNKQAAVIARNYKAQVKSPAQVQIEQPQAAQYYGDEPFWLAQKHPSSFVFVGPQKWQTALYAQENTVADFFIIDDGFQHRALARNLDMVLIDVTQFDSFLQREPLSALERADLVVLTKVNKISTAEVQKIRSQLGIYQTVYEVAYQSSFSEAFSGEVLGVCGIARPQSFKQSLQEQRQIQVLDFMVFADHHSYTEKDVQKIILRAREIGAKFVVTTEKDEVKLRPYWPLDIELKSLKIKLEWMTEPQKIYEFLDSAH